MKEEDFTKDLEDIPEDEEETDKETDEEESAEDLEELLSEDEKTTDETIRIKSDYLNRFLANPWRNVQEEKPEITPIMNLETDLPEETKKEEEDEEENKIEYELFKEEETGEKYVNLTTETEIYDEKLSEGERMLEKQKKLYDSPKKVRKEINREKDSIKYVKVEDTIRTDYLSKKKFGN